MNDTQLNMIVRASVENLLAFGQDRHWFFLVEKEKGVIDKPLFRGDWVFEPYSDSTTIHKEAEKRLREVLDYGFPIRQIIYGYEVEVAEPEPETQIAQPTQAPVRRGVGLGGLALGAVAFFALGIFYVLGMADPKIIICLDDGSPEEEMPWVCLYSWEKR